MNSLSNEYRELLQPHESPCISLYQPTHRHHPDNVQDPIRFRTLVKSIEDELRHAYSTQDTRALLAPLRALADDRDFWNHALDGLAVLLAPGVFLHYRLQRPVPELAVVADSFHTKPLLRMLQSADRFQILALSRQDARIYEGNRDAVDEVELDERVPRTITEALGDELAQRHVVISSRATGVGQPAIRHGFGARPDEMVDDVERYFRAVDRAVLEHHSKPSGLPLILATLPEHHALFRRVSHNPSLLPDAINVHPDALTGDQLRERAWQLVAPFYLQRLHGLVEQFGASKARGAAENQLARIGEAAVERRIATLLIDADRHIPGRFDQATGQISVAANDQVLVDDLLDDLGEAVLRSGGDVVVVPAERMPTDTGIAAIYRY